METSSRMITPRFGSDQVDTMLLLCTYYMYLTHMHTCWDPLPHVRPGPAIDNRYVDGVSITVGCSTSERGRKHVFTLAAGTATGIAANAIRGTDFPRNVPHNESASRNYDACWLDVTRPLIGCFLGNCGCQGGDAILNELGLSDSPWRQQAPDFVGDGPPTAREPSPHV